MMVWPARVVTPEFVYERARFVFDDDGRPSVYDRKGRLLVRLEPSDGETAVRTADPDGGRVWWFTAGGTTWHVSQWAGRGCNCKGTAAVPLSAADSDLLAVPF